MPADVIQPIGKVLRLCQALVVGQTGDAVYPPAATTTSNAERGLGRLVVKQENMPYVIRESVAGGATTADFDANQAIAEKFMRCGFEYRNTLIRDLEIVLPSVEKLIAMGCKLGDRGSVRVTALNTEGTGGNSYAFNVAGSNKIFGVRSWSSGAGVDMAGWVLDWKIEDNDGNGTAIVVWITSGGVA